MGSENCQSTGKGRLPSEKVATDGDALHVRANSAAVTGGSGDLKRDGCWTTASDEPGNNISAFSHGAPRPTLQRRRHRAESAPGFYLIGNIIFRVGCVGTYTMVLNSESG